MVRLWYLFFLYVVYCFYCELAIFMLIFSMHNIALSRLFLIK